MKLLIRRNQKAGMIKGTKYTLYVRAQLTDEETSLVKKNSLASELLYYYEKSGSKPPESLTGALLKRMRDTALTVGKLVEGVEITCDNVAELLGVEEQIKHAALDLKSYLSAAASFGGEEVIDVDQALFEKYNKNG